MPLSETFMDRNKPHELLFMGIPVEQLSLAELQATVVFLAKQLDKERESNRRLRNTSYDSLYAED